MKINTESKALVSFILTCTDNFSETIGKLPIPNVYTLHNLCAFSYCVVFKNPHHTYKINTFNLAQRINEDLQCFPFSSNKEKEFLWDHYKKFIKENFTFTICIFLVIKST